MEILEIFVYSWGYAVLDTDGMCDGLSIWLHGDDEPCFDAAGHRDDLVLNLPGAWRHVW